MSRRPVRRRHRVARALAVLGVLVSAVGVFLHHSTWTAAPVLVGATFASWAWLCCVPALVLAAWGRSVPAALLAVLLVGTGVVQHGPLFRADGPDGGAALVVAVQNLEFGGADAVRVVDDARSSGADVLLTVEMTPDSARALDDAGARELFPHRALQPRAGAAGVGVFSRHPVDPGVLHPGFELGVLSTVAHTPAGPVTVVAAHPVSPIGPSGAPQRSAAEADRLQTVLAELPGDRPAVVGGDFNATWDHARFRRLERSGFRDSVDGGGDGLVATWPVDERVRPLIGIDHVLARGARSVGDTRAHDVPGTDHRGLVATVRLDAPAGR